MSVADPVISTIRRGQLVLAVEDIPAAQARAALNVLEAALAKMPLNTSPGYPSIHAGTNFAQVFAACRKTIDLYEAAEQMERGVVSRDAFRVSFGLPGEPLTVDKIDAAIREAHHDGTPYG